MEEVKLGQVKGKTIVPPNLCPFLTHTQTHHRGSISHSEGGLLSLSCDMAAVLLYLLQQLAHRLAVIGHFAFLQECFQLQGHWGGVWERGNGCKGSSNLPVRCIKAEESLWSFPQRGAESAWQDPETQPDSSILTGFKLWEWGSVSRLPQWLKLKNVKWCNIISQDQLFHLNDGWQGKLWEANGAGLSVEVFQHQVIQLVDQPILKHRLNSKIHPDVQNFLLQIL